MRIWYDSRHTLDGHYTRTPPEVIDIKLKLQPGHTADLDWMAPSQLWQLFWNVTYACNFRCDICFSNAGQAAADELSTAEAKALIRSAHKAGVTDIVVSGGEPFLRKDLVELLTTMAELDISARIATHGALVTEPMLRRLRSETKTKSFQVSLDTLDTELYAELHGAPPSALDAALDALRCIRDLGFHTTVSTRLSPRTLHTLPALLDKAADEGWATVTIHCPLHTGRTSGAWPQNTDVVARLAPVFDHFLTLPKHWVVETTIPWAPYHPTLRALSKRVRVTHAGCGAGRCRLAVGASGRISPCICIDLPEATMGNVRTDDLATVFRESPVAHMMRRPQDFGICTDCPNVERCGGGCRSVAYALTGRLDGLDESCPVRKARRLAERERAQVGADARD